MSLQLCQSSFLQGVVFLELVHLHRQVSNLQGVVFLELCQSNHLSRKLSNLALLRHVFLKLSDSSSQLANFAGRLGAP